MRSKPFETLGRQPPAPFGIAAPGAASRTGRVDQDEVGFATPVIELLKLARRIEQPALDGHARPRGPWGSFDRRARLLSVARIAALGAAAAKREGLAARSSAKVDDLLDRLRLACERDQLAALILDLDEPRSKAG